MYYSDLTVVKIGKHKWRLSEDWVTPFVTVPKGTVSDGASVPRLFWWFADPAGELFEAAVLHDYMYAKALNSKRAADGIFYHTAVHFKTTKWKAKVAYWFVKTFGRGKYV